MFTKMTSGEYIRQHATNIRELLNLRELNDSLAGSIDNDLDIWVEFFTRRDIKTLSKCVSFHRRDRR